MKKLLSVCAFVLCLGGVGVSLHMYQQKGEACGEASSALGRQAAFWLQLSVSMLRAEAATALLSARNSCPSQPRLAPPRRGQKARQAWLARRDQAYNEETARVMQRALRPTSNTVDVGTYKGDVLAQMRALAPLGHHWGFEPLPHLVRGLKRRFRAQPRVHIVAAALSDHNGHATFQHVVTNPGYSGLKRRQYERKETIRQLRVKVHTMDRIIPHTRPIHFIKIDVEGAEYQVLRGARQTIMGSRPTIIFEHGKGASDRYGTTPTRLYRLLHGEYQMAINTMPALSLQAFQRQYQTGRNWYFIATPREPPS